MDDTSEHRNRPRRLFLRALCDSFQRANFDDGRRTSSHWSKYVTEIRPYVVRPMLLHDDDDKKTKSDVAASRRRREPIEMMDGAQGG